MVAQPSELELSAVITDVACASDASGAIDLTVEGGTGDITYSWSNEASTEDLTGIPAGEYTVEVTDGSGCTATATYTVTESAALEISVVSSDLLCNGDNSGSIDVTVTGGSGDYVYNWSDESADEDRTDLPAGTYGLTVTDNNGCTNEVSVEITEPDAIELTLVTTDVLCNGGNTGSIDLTVAGGTPPAAFIWSNGDETEDISMLVAGTYTVTVTDVAGCEAVGSATINEPIAISLSVVASDAQCAGEASGSIDLEIEGGTEGYTVLWSNGAETEDLTGILAGTYSATVTDANGCTAETALITIGEPSTLSLSLIHI